VVADSGEVPESKPWMEREDLPFDYYGDLIRQADLVMADMANQDGGVWEVKQEKYIAECMKAAGFEYYPNEVEPLVEGESDIKVGERTLMVAWLPEDLASVERYGYGYYGSDDSLSKVIPTAEPVEVNQNEEYVDSLSASAQKEYDIALMGPELAEYNLETDIDSKLLPEMGGCMGQASEKHPYPLVGAMEESPSARYKDLLDLMGEEASDPYSVAFARREEIDALNDAWLDCFEQGFPIARSDVTQLGLNAEEVAEAKAAMGEFNGPSSAWDLAIHTNAEGKYWEGHADQAPDEYKSLTGTPREIAIAVVDYKCREKTDYVNRFLAIEREAEEEFITAHKTELDEMVAALEDYIKAN
jgi:hypothetical protein